MTEAAHQMASNPLPPRARKPGSVGLAAGPEIAVMDATGESCRPARPARSSSAARTSPPATKTTRSQRRGVSRRLVPHRRPGLDRRRRLPAADRPAQGADQSRRREDLRRARSTRCCSAHPAVEQAVCFAVAHAQLGEEVGAAIELRADACGHGVRVAGVGRRAPAGLQGAARHPLPRRDSQGPDRQASARRAGGSARHRAARRPRAARSRGPPVRRENAHRRDLGGMFPGESIGVTTRFEALGGDSLSRSACLPRSARGSAATCHTWFLPRTGPSRRWPRLDAATGEPASPLVALRAAGSQAPLYCIPGHDGAAARDRSARARTALDPARVGVRPAAPRPRR